MQRSVILSKFETVKIQALNKMQKWRLDCPAFLLTAEETGQTKRRIFAPRR
jgi:hypothetical protein